MHTVYVNPNTNTVYVWVNIVLCTQFMHTVCSYEKQLMYSLCTQCVTMCSCVLYFYKFYVLFRNKFLCILVRKKCVVVFVYCNLENIIMRNKATTQCVVVLWETMCSCILD